VDDQPESPFENIESALQFVELLCDAIEESRREIEQASAETQSDRRQQALQLVSYNLAKLALHMGTSRRILNDLRTLRRLFLQERGTREEEEQGEAAEGAAAAGELADAADGAGFID
jgi:hypothetical protein